MRRNRRKFLGGRGDRVTPLFIYLTHACGCIVLGKGCHPVTLSPPTLYIAICVDLFHASFAYQPSACTGFPDSLALEACLLEYHS